MIQIKITGFLQKIKRLFCKHDYEFIQQEEWNPDIKFCSKCNKTIYYYDKFKN